MTEAEILASFRDTYGDCVGWSEHHLAHCPEAEVLRFEVTGEDTFESLLKCPHSRPMGYSVLPKAQDVITALAAGWGWKETQHG